MKEARLRKKEYILYSIGFFNEKWSIVTKMKLAVALGCDSSRVG